MEEEESQVLLQSSHKPARLRNNQYENLSPEAELSGITAPTALAQQVFPINQQAATASSHGPEAVPLLFVPTALNMASLSEPPVQTLWDRTKRTYSAARLWQARTAHSVGSSFRAAEQAGRGSYNLGKRDNIAPDFAQLVDAAFARDARRYDGPLRIL